MVVVVVMQSRGFGCDASACGRGKKERSQQGPLRNAFIPWARCQCKRTWPSWPRGPVQHAVIQPSLAQASAGGRRNRAEPPQAPTEQAQRPELLVHWRPWAPGGVALGSEGPECTRRAATPATVGPCWWTAFGEQLSARCVGMRHRSSSDRLCRIQRTAAMQRFQMPRHEYVC